MSIYIALGANLSNPKETFIDALDKLSERGIEIVSVSGLWQSPSWPPGQGHPDYLNAVACVNFQGSAENLLSILQDVEMEFGRKRSIRNAPRSLDLDIVAFDQKIVSTESLKVPHPRMLERGFVLLPLQELAPDWTDPVSGHRIDYFITRLPLADVGPIEYVGKFYNTDAMSGHFGQSD